MRWLFTFIFNARGWWWTTFQLAVAYLRFFQMRGLSFPLNIAFNIFIIVLNFPSTSGTYIIFSLRLINLLRLLEKQNPSSSPLFFFSPPLLRNNGDSNGEFGAIKYFTDYWTANTIQLFVAIWATFLWSILFLNKPKRRGIPQRILDKCSPLFICIVLK